MISALSTYPTTDPVFKGGSFINDVDYNPPQEENIHTQNARIDRSLWYNVENAKSMYTDTDLWNGTPIHDLLKEESVPRFEQWASAVVGQIAVTYNGDDFPHLKEERAAVVLTNAARMYPAIEDKFQFAGFVRTSFNAPLTTATGPAGDEYFTLIIGGKVQVLNNSGETLKVGDSVSWTFAPAIAPPTIGLKRVRDDTGPRQIRLKKTTFFDKNRIGKVIQVSSPNGTMVDILLQAVTL